MNGEQTEIATPQQPAPRARLTEEQFKYYWDRPPTCKCKNRTKMTLREDCNYHCHHCGMVVSLLAAGADIRDVDGKDRRVIVSKPHS